MAYNYIFPGVPPPISDGVGLTRKRLLHGHELILDEQGVQPWLAKLTEPLRRCYIDDPRTFPRASWVNDRQPRQVVFQHSATLRSLPDGYALARRQRENSKHVDKYLYGHPSGGTFRSAEEFKHHLVWLARRTVDPDLRCACRLCTRARRRPRKNDPGAKDSRALATDSEDADWIDSETDDSEDTDELSDEEDEPHVARPRPRRERRGQSGSRGRRASRSSGAIIEDADSDARPTATRRGRSASRRGRSASRHSGQRVQNARTASRSSAWRGEYTHDGKQRGRSSRSRSSARRGEYEHGGNRRGRSTTRKPGPGVQNAGTASQSPPRRGEAADDGGRSAARTSESLVEDPAAAAGPSRAQQIPKPPEERIRPIPKVNEGASSSSAAPAAKRPKPNPSSTAPRRTSAASTLRSILADPDPFPSLVLFFRSRIADYLRTDPDPFFGAWRKLNERLLATVPEELRETADEAFETAAVREQIGSVLRRMTMEGRWVVKVEEVVRDVEKGLDVRFDVEEGKGWVRNMIRECVRERGGECE
ncbi:hypothetical protein HDU96_007074 [Phlyctochytrium bullatum]|nr:hypothetical protein HDU96_007074 [Phlyctochytrium bullatum]